MTDAPEPYSLGPLAAHDIEALHLLTVEASWPHRPDDWRFVLGLGHGLAARDAAGRIVGCAMWWPFGEEDATVGMVLVSHRLQGRGIGRRLMADVLEAAARRRIWLNATEEGRPLYEKLGFRPVGTIRQRQGLAVLPAGEAPPAEGEVRPFAAQDLSEIVALDRAASGRARGTLIEALADRAEGVVHEVEGRIAGFAFTRAFGRGHVVGPIVARNDAAAIALVRPSVEAHAGTFLRTDMPFEDGPYVRFIEAAGLAQVDTALTMLLGDGAPEPRGPAKVYGLASQALG